MIRFEGVMHDFGRGRVLDGITAELRPGSVSVLCGPNAAGKTTLLRIGAGLLDATGGRVHLDGSELSARSASDRARMLGFMPQRFECTSGFSVRRVLELARVLIGRKQAVLDRVIAELDLEDLLERSVISLSVGQAQRVALARVLAQVPAPGTVLLDEPLSALDPHWEARVADLLRARAAEGATVLLSVHALATAGMIADDVLLLAEGRLVARGPVAEVLEPATLESAYGIPFELVRTATGAVLPVPRSGS